MKKIGFIGLGTMGLPMAANLLKAGYDVIAYNRTQAKLEKFVSQGGKAAASAAEVAESSDVIFTMLTADCAVEEVIFGEKGIIKAVKAGQIVIDSSTISPNTSIKLAQELGKLGVEVLDAPVTGLSLIHI